MSQINVADVQRPIIRGYNFDQARHYLLRIASRKKALLFLGKLANNPELQITHGEMLAEGTPKSFDWLKAYGLNMAFTYAGLRILNVNSALLKVVKELAPAYAQGANGRASLVGDTDNSDASFWDSPFKQRNAHVLISLYGNSDKILTEKLVQMRKLPGSEGLQGWDTPQLTKHLSSDRSDRREHFGFRDGISQPCFNINGKATIKDSPPQLHTAIGEFILGYRNADSRNHWGGLDIDPEARDFFKNGSFAALRKVEQDVEKFNHVTQQLAKQHSTKANPIDKRYIQAKICGRWPNGALLRPGETKQPRPPKLNDNDFDYAQDKLGQGCPFGSHIRRSNPRSDGVVPTRKRFILRRGMPYGPAWNKKNKAVPRGLLGLFFCASLEDQFEFIMTDWINSFPTRPDARSNCKDPLIGQQEAQEKSLSIPRKNGSELVLNGLEAFVTTRGMVYLFYPSVSALEKISLQKT